MVYIVKKNVVKGGDLMEAIAAKIAYNVTRVGDVRRRRMCRARLLRARPSTAGAKPRGAHAATRCYKLLPIFGQTVL